MYEHFFGFSDKPFKHTPNTKALYLSDVHDAALRTLTYGIESRSGFLLFTGEVGSGKTTTIRKLLTELNGKVETSLILNPLISTIDLIRSINKDFGNACPSLSLQDQLESLNQYLLTINSYNKTALVVIDEAQNLSLEALEMTRMLSNLETENEKLINILLVGQPELEEKLAKRELRQLAQRIQVHAKLCPLTLLQTELYIQHRLHHCGQAMSAYFDKNAVKRIYKKSNGIPRLINNICEISLLVAFCKNTKVIDDSIIKQALKEVPKYVHYS